MIKARHNSLDLISTILCHVREVGVLGQDRRYLYQHPVYVYVRADSGMVILNRQRIAYIDIN